jgi:tetratricopeptide (TPR) repeat protein
MRLLSAAALFLSATTAAAEPTARPVSVDQLVARIEEAFDENRMTEVAVLLDNPAVRTASSDALLSLRARYALASGDLAAAGRIADSPEAEASVDCRIRSVRGLVHDAQGKVDQAINELGSAAEVCPLDPESWLALARLLATRHEEMASFFALDKARALAPGSLAARRLLGHTLLQFGRQDEARRELDLLLRIDPGDVAARDDRDLLAGLMGEDIQRDPKDSDRRWVGRLLNAAQGAKRAGKVERERALAAQAVLAAPKFDPALFAQAAPH